MEDLESRIDRRIRTQRNIILPKMVQKGLNPQTRTDRLLPHINNIPPAAETRRANHCIQNIPSRVDKKTMNQEFIANKIRQPEND